MTFRTDLDVRSIDPKTWLLLADLVYEGSKGDVIVVPAGSRTDFASVPQIFQSWTPRTGTWTKAAVVHDHLCTLLREGRPTDFDAVDTDGVFRLIMEEEGVGPIRRWLMWAAVRWGALTEPARRPGWWRTSRRLLAITAAVVAFPVLLVALI